MSQDDVPWLRSDAKSDVEPLNKLESGTGAEDGPRERVGKAKIIYWSLKVVTMGLCLLMAATSVIGLCKLTKTMYQSMIRNLFLCFLSIQSFA